MRYSVSMLNIRTDERRSIVATLSAGEQKTVASLRRHKGAMTADINAQAMALSHVYRDLDGNDWRHVDAPSLVQPS